MGCHMATLKDYHVCGTYRGPVEDAHRYLNEAAGNTDFEWNDLTSRQFSGRVGNIFRLTKGDNSPQAKDARRFAGELIERAKGIGSPGYNNNIGKF